MFVFFPLTEEEITYITYQGPVSPDCRLISLHLCQTLRLNVTNRLTFIFTGETRGFCGNVSTEKTQRSKLVEPVMNKSPLNAEQRLQTNKAIELFVDLLLS